jgi:hypothetical protein
MMLQQLLNLPTPTQTSQSVAGFVSSTEKFNFTAIRPRRWFCH